MCIYDVYEIRKQILFKPKPDRALYLLFWWEIHRLFEYFILTGPPMEHMKEIARALRCIADELDQDQKMQRYGLTHVTEFVLFSVVLENSVLPMS